VYSTDGIFNIQLKISDSNTELATIFQPVQIILGSITVNVTPSRSIALVNENILFTSHLTGGVLPYNYMWNFGDGQEIFNGTSNVAYMFTRPGNHLVTLTVSDSAGHVQTGNATVPVTINQPLCNETSTCHIATITNPNPVPGDTVSFTVTTIGGVPPYNYNWDFGDNSKSSGSSPNAVHTYTKPGTYKISVIITDGENHAITMLTSVNVKPVLQGGFIGLLPLPLFLLIVTSGAILSIGVYIFRMRLFGKFLA
jgi:hypothetical protein